MCQFHRTEVLSIQTLILLGLTPPIPESQKDNSNQNQLEDKE
jgi:hypothetical protein